MPHHWILAKLPPCRTEKGYHNARLFLLLLFVESYHDDHVLEFSFVRSTCVIQRVQGCKILCALDPDHLSATRGNRM